MPIALKIELVPSSNLNSGASSRSCIVSTPPPYHVVFVIAPPIGVSKVLNGEIGAAWSIAVLPKSTTSTGSPDASTLVGAWNSDDRTLIARPLGILTNLWSPIGNR